MKKTLIVAAAIAMAAAGCQDTTTVEKHGKKGHPAVEVSCSKPSKPHDVKHCKIVKHRRR